MFLCYSTSVPMQSDFFVISVWISSYFSWILLLLWWSSGSRWWQKQFSLSALFSAISYTDASITHIENIVKTLLAQLQLCHMNIFSEESASASRESQDVKATERQKTRSTQVKQRGKTASRLCCQCLLLPSIVGLEEVQSAVKTLEFMFLTLCIDESFLSMVLNNCIGYLVCICVYF